MSFVAVWRFTEQLYCAVTNNVKIADGVAVAKYIFSDFIAMNFSASNKIILFLFQ